MDHQRGRQLGINTAALDMALGSTRSQVISKVLTAPGTFAARSLKSYIAMCVEHAPGELCRRLKSACEKHQGRNPRPNGSDYRCHHTPSVKSRTLGVQPTRFSFLLRYY
jgi:hypothetical protein